MENIEKQTASDYYLTHRNEFTGESGHEKIIQLLIDNVDEVDDSKTVVLGIDVGANVGKYIPNIRKMCKEKNHKIMCIEPNHLNFDILSKNASDDVLLFNMAVSNKAGVLPLYAYHEKNYDGNPHGGLFSKPRGQIIQYVNVITLDSLVADVVGDDNYVIKFVKIDTEGHDTMVIKGMDKILHKTKYIIFECSDCLDDLRGPGEKNPMKTIVDFLDDHGFDVYRLGTKRLLKVNGSDWSDVYEKVKFWSNCFAVQKTDHVITNFIDEDGFYMKSFR